MNKPEIEIRAKAIDEILRFAEADLEDLMLNLEMAKDELMADDLVDTDLDKLFDKVDTVAAWTQKMNRRRSK